jgi:hypothetical protein
VPIGNASFQFAASWRYHKTSDAAATEAEANSTLARILLTVLHYNT